MALSIYAHIPFCRVRCAYCDFNTYAGLEDLMPAYARALADEFRTVGACTSDPVHTVFFGGGTPSLLPIELWANLFDALYANFALTADCEITVEANPGTVDYAYFKSLHDLGANRVSFGVQSAQPHELRLLDRQHTFADVRRTVRSARRAGLDNLNLDLIFALPHQTLDSWRDTLRRALTLQPEHLSLYALSLEYGTPMRSWVNRGLLPLPDPDLAADMYEAADELLAGAGFEQYEISNWTRPAHACRHNLQYWRNQPYLGFGAGAHGYSGGWRYAVVRSPRAYITRMEAAAATEYPFSPALASRRRIDVDTAMNEAMLLGLRLTREGVQTRAFRERFGVGPEEAFGGQLALLRSKQLVETTPESTRLTHAARLVANHAFGMFV
ncbi:MAG: radical SAM family heme chaperone HemW [Anaerolineales bacterium]